MLEKAIVALGCLIGVAAGYGYFLAADELRLPSLLFFFTDMFGTIPGAIVAGLLTIPVATGLLVLGIDLCLPRRRDADDR